MDCDSVSAQHGFAQAMATRFKKQKRVG
jgi:hypothetical protein